MTSHHSLQQEQGVILDIENLKVIDDRKIEAVKDVSLQVRNGEIFGIAGVDGNGQRELVEALTGLRHPAAGKVGLIGVEMTGKSPGEIWPRALPISQKTASCADW